MSMLRCAFVLACLLLALTARAAVVEIEAGPIWNNMDAGSKCPGVCMARGALKWDGNWWTTSYLGGPPIYVSKLGRPGNCNDSSRETSSAGGTDGKAADRARLRRVVGQELGKEPDSRRG